MTTRRDRFVRAAGAALLLAPALAGAVDFEGRGGGFSVSQAVHELRGAKTEIAAPAARPVAQAARDGAKQEGEQAETWQQKRIAEILAEGPAAAARMSPAERKLLKKDVKEGLASIESGESLREALKVIYAQIDAAVESGQMSPGEAAKVREMIAVSLKAKVKELEGMLRGVLDALESVE